MRETGARIALAQFGIKLGAARDDEGIDERGTRAEEPAAALRDPVAQRAAAMRRRIELSDTASDEYAAARVGGAQESPGHDPHRAAMRRMTIGPADEQGSAAATRLRDGFYDPTRSRRWVIQTNNGGMCCGGVPPARA